MRENDISITAYAATCDANIKKSWSGTDACSLKRHMQRAARHPTAIFTVLFLFIFNYLMDPSSRAPEELQAAAYAKVMPIIRSGAHILFWASLHNVEGLISCQRKCSTVSWQPSYSLVTERQFCKLVEFF